jgi:hypothetical protein
VVVSGHGEEFAVVTDRAERHSHQGVEGDFKAFLRSAPDLELDIDRPADRFRAVDLGGVSESPRWTDRPVG